MRHGCPYRVPAGWRLGVPPAHIGAIRTFPALPVLMPAEAVKRAGNGIWGPQAVQSDRPASGRFVPCAAVV